MDSGLDDHNKCRVCLTPDTCANFIQLDGSKAEMFTEVIGVELTIDDFKIESVICQNCFSELDKFHDFKAKGIRAHREYFEIQRQLSTQRETHDTEQAPDEVEESEAEAIAIEPHSLARVKHEPPVEFVLILPRATIDRSGEEDADINQKWVESVQLKKFDAKWPSESRQFQTFLSCKHCRHIVKNQGHLAQHLKTCNKIKPARFKCDICGERVQEKWLMERHMLKHSSETKFRCTECGNGFKTKSELILHKKIHDKPIACTNCQKKFARNEYLKGHQMQHRHGSYATAPEKTFGCEKCDKSFSTPKYLKQHQEKVHDENEAKCDVCGKVCKNRASLLYHGHIHAKVECSICHRMISKKAMARHVQTHFNHFECDICAFSTNVKGSLKQHIERMHLLEKLVKEFKREDFSDFELLKKFQLRYRSSATSNEKKFQCDKCEKAFLTPSTLNRHKRDVHPEKLFDCQLCKKAYKTKEYLKDHKIRVHAKMPVK